MYLFNIGWLGIMGDGHNLEHDRRCCACGDEEVNFDVNFPVADEQVTVDIMQAAESTARLKFGQSRSHGQSANPCQPSRLMKQIAANPVNPCPAEDNSLACL